LRPSIPSATLRAVAILAISLRSRAVGEIRVRQPGSFKLWTAAAILFVVGLYLRLAGIHSSLWLDEFGTFWTVERDYWTSLQRCWSFQGQSPFYYTLAWIPLHVLGESELALRGPSLLLGLALAVMASACASRLAGARAGVFAFFLVWLSPPCIRASAEARPYALVLFTASVAIYGFIASVRTGTPAARTAWVAGGAAVCWAHYVHYPLVLGLVLAYLVLPSLREAYRPRTFLKDLILQTLAAALCFPQILALLYRRSELSWLDGVHPLAFLPLLIPLSLALLLGECPPPRERPHERAMRQALWVSLLLHVATIEALALVGLNLLHPRYLVSIVVPATILAAVALGHLRRSDAIAAVSCFTLVTVGTLALTKVSTGTFSGVGSEDWRGAVGRLSNTLQEAPRALVLLRSGFVEADRTSAGFRSSALVAPLRSPGEPAFCCPVVPLTYRWNASKRKEYFERVVRPLVMARDVFYVLAGTPGPEPEPYLTSLLEWVQDCASPASVVVGRERFGNVELLTIQRRNPRHVPSADLKDRGSSKFP